MNKYLIWWYPDQDHPIELTFTIPDDEAQEQFAAWLTQYAYAWEHDNER